MLQDARIALEWANNRVKLYGFSDKYPNEYKQALILQGKAQKKFDELVEKWINKNCTS